MLIKYNVESDKIKFDEIFYKRHHQDLQNLNNNDLINHYIKHGKVEKRLFCDIQLNFNWMQYKINKKLDNSIYNNIHKIWEHYLYYEIININRETVILKHPNEISVNIEFNSYYYAQKNRDLIKLNNVELYTHYHKYGRKEQRIFTERVKQFNFVYYYLIHEDLKFDNIDDLWRHYIYYGIKEKRHCDFNTIIKFNENNLTENQKFVYLSIIPISIIEEKGRQEKQRRLEEQRSQEQKRQQNNRNSRSITTSKTNNSNNISSSNNKNNIINSSFTIPTNGNHNVPKTAIIYVFYNRPGELRNESNLAFFIRQTVLVDKSNIYLFIINGYTCEVIFPQQSNLFVLKNRNCYDFESYGIGINYLKKKFGQNLNGIHRIVTMNCGVTGPFYRGKHWLSEFENKLSSSSSFVCSTIIYRLEKINNNANSDIRTPGYFNYFINDSNIINQLMQRVFIRHNSKESCILNGEYGFAKLLIQNNKTIISIVDNYNKNISQGWRGDRNNNLDRFDLYSLIFIKINWRSLNGRDSIPVKYNNVISEMNNISKFSNPIESYFRNINYNILPINNQGQCYTNSYNWNSKQDFYNKFGKAEEFIIYPTLNNFNKLALYAHSDADNTLKDYCVTAINTLSLLGYEVIILTTCRTFINIKNLPYKIVTISEAKTDLYMFQKYFNSGAILNKYSHLLLCNDTIVFPIHGINNMQKSIDNIINICDYFGIWNSPEIKEHLILSFLHFNNKMFAVIKSYLNSYNLFSFGTVGNLNDAQKCEINFVSHLSKHNFTYRSIVDYKTLNNINYQCAIFHPNVFPQWINRTEVFAIKWKYMGNYINKNKINNSNLNYLLRYIHFNHTDPKGKPEQNGAYSNPENYVKLQ